MGGPRREVERVTRIELALSAWEAEVLPLNYTRMSWGPKNHTSPAAPRHTCPRFSSDGETGGTCGKFQSARRWVWVALEDRWKGRVGDV